MIAHRKSLLKRSPFLVLLFVVSTPIKSQSFRLFIHARPHRPHLDFSRSSFFRACRPGSGSSRSPPHPIRDRSGSIPLAGFSSAWPLSVYSPLFTKQTFIVGPYSHGLFPHWATLYASHGIPAVVQSLSSSVGNPLLLVLNRLGTTQPFKCDAPIVLHPLTPSLAFAL